jgi:GTPase involved in cell partitioning and DNA repair
MKAVHLARIPEIIQGAGALEALGATLAGHVPLGSALLLVVRCCCSPIRVFGPAA